MVAGLATARCANKAVSSAMMPWRRRAGTARPLPLLPDCVLPCLLATSRRSDVAPNYGRVSVHLARAWTSWRTLLMDDPVQHVDDFRALHLIEVLAALRLGGRQVVCAVEDEALAELLCRRLLSSSESIGRRYNLDIGHEAQWRQWPIPALGRPSQVFGDNPHVRQIRTLRPRITAA